MIRLIAFLAVLAIAAAAYATSGPPKGYPLPKGVVAVCVTQELPRGVHRA